MKKLVWLSFAILLLAASCTTYSCPTYAMDDTKDNDTNQVEEKI